MPYCKKCGVQCLDDKVRCVHEEKCARRMIRGTNRIKKTKGNKEKGASALNDHGYALNVSCLIPNISTEHSYSNVNSSTQIPSCSTILSTEHSDHTYNKPRPVTYLCEHCGQRFKYLERKAIHENLCTKVRRFLCHTCGVQCKTHKELYAHRRMHKIKQNETKLQSPPWEKENKHPPWYDIENETEAKMLEKVYNLHKDIILQCDRIGSVIGIYNIPLDNKFTIDTIIQKINSIYNHSDFTFKVNLTFSTILQNIETREFRYFQGYRNNALLEEPPVISNTDDLNKLKDTLETKDIFNHLMLQRENTKHKPVMVTNVNIWIYNTNYVLGHEPIVLPPYLSCSKTLLTFSSYKQNTSTKYYKDNLCAFRSLCYYKNPLLYEQDYVTFEVSTLELFEIWVEFADKTMHKTVNKKSFPGITLSDVSYFEDCFNINIQLYEKLDKDTVIPVYKSTKSYPNTLQMNIYNHHLSLILDFPAYAKKFKCKMCNKLFNKHFSYSRHEQQCNNATKIKFKGGFYKGNPTIFEELDLVGIYTKPEDRVYPWFIVYDFEAVLEKLQHSTSSVTELTNKHFPISVAVCSNISQYRKPICIMNSDYPTLINQWFSILDSIHEVIICEARAKWEYIVVQLDELCSLWEHRDDSLMHNDDNDNSSEEILNNNNNDQESYIHHPSIQESEEYSQKEMYTLLTKLQEKLEQYINRVPVIGFNSSKYDLLLCRTEFTKHIGLYNSSSENQCYVIKKGETYPSVTNDKFMFLDILNYLAPGYSYAQFLKAYNVKESKLFFPYEYISSTSVLNETQLPPIGKAWFSTLKQQSVLDNGVSSVVENYEFVQEQWKANNMNTLWDLLSWYNKGDVEPFVLGIESFLQFYYSKEIDVFKIAISTPGIARKMLIDTAKKSNVYFSVIDSKNQDLFYKIRNNLTGGPSIIFNRYLKVNETNIRGITNNKCKSIIGWDAASLYLYCMSLEQPSGIFIRRKETSGYYPEIRDRYYSPFHWMDWMIKYQNKHISHLMNSGSEKRIGPFLVDGYDATSDTCYEFYGCWFHSHIECNLSGSLSPKQKKKRYERTMKREAYIRQRCENLIVIWECEYLLLKKNVPNLQSIINSSRPPFYQKNKKQVSFHNIVQSIKNNTLYGFIECDISTTHKRNESVESTSYQYFSEMSPIFCTTEVSYEHFGAHMQSFVNEHKLSTRNRTLLVGGMSAKKILLHSKLLKWYLDHGMYITRIYEVIEFTPSKCFTDFTTTITQTRREAEKNPDKQIIGQTFKIIGNSGMYDT